MSLGELQIKPADFWTLTNGELMAILRGYVIRRDMESANHRNLYTFMVNINRKKGSSAKSPTDVWELDIDSEFGMDIEERLEIYKRIGNANTK